MKQIVFADFVEYNYPIAKLGNYHICNQFVKNGYEALWVSNTFNGLIRLKDKTDYDAKKAVSQPARNRLADNVYGFAARSWRLYGNYPFCRDPRIITNMPKTISPDVKNSLARLGFGQADILWVSNPKLYWLADVIDYRRLVYRIADDYAHFKNFPNIAELESRFIQKADHVFITSGLFREKVLRLGKTPVVLNNAVDIEHFSSKQGMPPEYENPARKKILYVGSITYWLDLELIAELAGAVDADIYLIGQESISLERLRSCPNVKILGARPFDSVPSYMQHADVAIIPFVTGELTAAISPLKLFEYCAAGTPVVSTYMEEVRQMQAPIYVARDYSDFIAGVKEAMENPPSASILKEYAAANTWDRRFDLIMEELFGNEA